MAAREDEAQAFVRDRGHLVVFLVRLQLRQAGEQLGFVDERPVTAKTVDGAVPGGRDDPGTGIRRLSVRGPALERGREGVLHRVLGKIEVPEDADEDRNRATPFLAEQGLDC